MNKNQSKYFSTAAKMDNALIALLEKKEFAYITVKEICESAGVNRSTFYLHYENTVDLLQEAVRYILDRFLAYFPCDVQEAVKNLSDRTLNELFFMTPKYIMPYLAFIKDNRRLFQTAIRKFGAMGFEKVYQDMYRHIFDPLLSRFHFPEQERPFVMKFYLSGITAIVNEWIEGGCKESGESICGIIIECVMHKGNAEG